MEKLIFRLIVAGLFFFTAVELPAQVTAVGHITAEVVTSLTATETSPLSFGQFSPESSGGEYFSPGICTGNSSNYCYRDFPTQFWKVFTRNKWR